MCKEDITDWKPDVVILVDYAGFNLKIAQFLTDYKNKIGTKKPKVTYFISPKIWAWNESRIKHFKRNVDEMLCILPFEVEFFEKKHNYPVHYVGNPTADEVRLFKENNAETREEFCLQNGLDPQKPIIALLAGSRLHEIKDNLPAMIEATKDQSQVVLAGAPSIDKEVYEPLIRGTHVHLVMNKTYALLSHSTAAVVTSGTATLETALFDVPQVVCFRCALPRLYRFLFNHLVHCDYISLVNLIAGREVVAELFADRFSVLNIKAELADILPGGKGRQNMLNGYREVHQRLGTRSAAENAARIIKGLGIKD